MSAVVLTPRQLGALLTLSRWPNGQGAILGVMSGGDLSALVRFGLVDRCPRDRVGGARYRVNDAGWAALKRQGLAADWAAHASGGETVGEQT